MLTFENVQVQGWGCAIMGLYYDLGEKCDPRSYYCYTNCEHCSRPTRTCVLRADPEAHIGALNAGGFYLHPKDADMLSTERAPYAARSSCLKQVRVTVEITAPMYWWSELESILERSLCAAIRTIPDEPFKASDFSYTPPDITVEAAYQISYSTLACYQTPQDVFEHVIERLNYYRSSFISTGDVKYYWLMMQALPCSYNQKRHVQFSYSTLETVYQTRLHDACPEWSEDFVSFIKSLPYSKIITGGK